MNFQNGGEEGVMVWGFAGWILYSYIDGLPLKVLADSMDCYYSSYTDEVVYF